MKASRQKELLCRAIWAYMREYEERMDGIDGEEVDATAEAIRLFGLTDKEVKEINKFGRDLGCDSKPVICNL